jgi:hypothetical protein
LGAGRAALDHGMRPQIQIPLLYAIFSALWIWTSDRALVRLVSDPDLLVTVSMAKGWFFILCTTILLWWLIRRAVAAEQQREREKRVFLAENCEMMNHVTRNFLNKMQIFRHYAENQPTFDRDVLALYDTIVAEAQRDIERLSNVQELSAGSLRRSLMERAG